MAHKLKINKLHNSENSFRAASRKRAIGRRSRAEGMSASEPDSTRWRATQERDMRPKNKYLQVLL